MFCNQCQETLGNKGCTMRGVCGKTNEVADLQDLLIHSLRGISYFQRIKRGKGIPDKEADEVVMEHLFSTITNTNFDQGKMFAFIRRSLSIRDRLRKELEAQGERFDELPDHATWQFTTEEDAHEKTRGVGHLSIENEDLRSLMTILLYGNKGISAYLHHAYMLGKGDDEIFAFMNESLLAYRDPGMDAEKLLGLVM